MSFRTPNYEKRTEINGWKSEQQKLTVLGRLASAGIEVDITTPASQAWKLLTELLLKELKS